MWAEGESAPPSKRQKYPTDGAPTVYMEYVFEDWSMAGIAADALGTYGVDIYVDWTSARLFGFDERAVERLRLKLAEPGARLVACLSERSKDTDRLLSVLKSARETMAQKHYAVLPVRYESTDWALPAAFTAFPRIEARGDDLVVISPNSSYHLPYRRWLRLPGGHASPPEDDEPA